MKKKDRFACWLPCKPYVKQFLLINFNAPDSRWDEIINLSSDRDLQDDFVRRLKKRDTRNDDKYVNLYRYTTKVPIEISRDTFYRHGWILTNTDAVGFGAKVEHRVKQILFLYLDTYVSMGIPLSVAIRNFQSLFCFDDDSWPYDSIRREYNRHGCAKRDDTPTIFEHFNKLIMDKLSQFGTISQQGKKTYEEI